MCLCTHVVFNWMEEDAEFTPQRGADRPDVRGKGNLVETKKKDPLQTDILSREGCFS